MTESARSDSSRKTLTYSRIKMKRAVKRVKR